MGRNKKYTIEELKNSLNMASKSLGEFFTAKEYEKWSKKNKLPSKTAIIKEFGSWSNAKVALGISSNRNGSRNHFKEPNEVEIIKTLKSATNEVEGYLTRDKYQEWAKVNEAIGAYSIISVFGSWKNAIEQTNQKNINKEYYIKLLKKAISDRGESITFDEFSRWCKENNYPNGVRNHFNSWNEAKLALGVRKENLKRFN